MDKNQNNSRPVSNGTSFAELFQDVFGLQAWEEQKQSHQAQRSVPWQWVLWGGLFFFCLGFSFSSESPWIVVVAIAIAVIIFLARSTETIEPQVFLLTDDRTDEQKKAYQKKSQMKAAAFAKPTSDDKAELDENTSSDVSSDEVAEKFTKETRTRMKRPRRKERFKTKDTVADYPNDELAASRESAEAKPKPRKPRARHLRRTPRTTPKVEFKTKDTVADYPNDELAASRESAEAKPKPRKPRARHLRRTPRTTPKVEAPVITDVAPLKTEAPKVDAIDQTKASESEAPVPVQEQPHKTAVEEVSPMSAAPEVKVETQPQVTSESSTAAPQEPPKAS